MHEIYSCEKVDDKVFNSPMDVTLKIDGKVVRTNRIGWTEVHGDDIIWRYDSNGLCECTITVNDGVIINGKQVADVRRWMKETVDDVKEKSGFLVSSKLGLAVDLDDERYIYLTVFRIGLWD